MYSENPIVFEQEQDAFLLASKANPTPIFYASDSSEAVVIAVNTFADDVERVTGKRPDVQSAETVNRVNPSTPAILVGTVSSRLVQDVRQSSTSAQLDTKWTSLEGKWESWDVSVVKSEELGTNTVITGSDRVSFNPRLRLPSAWSDIRAIHSILVDGSLTMVLVGRCSYHIEGECMASARLGIVSW